MTHVELVRHFVRAAPEPSPGDRESQGAFIDDPIREGPPMDLFKRACDWIENIDIQYGPSPHSLAAEFARVRAEERERCANEIERRRIMNTEATENQSMGATVRTAYAYAGQELAIVRDAIRGSK